MPIQLRVGTAEQIAIAAADEVQRTVKRANTRRRAVIGTATGGTPEETYEEIVARVRDGRLDLSNTEMFGLDEYDGLPPDHPGSYHKFMSEKLWDPAGIRPEWRHLPSSANPAEYDQLIRHSCGGGVDLWILGIGRNGHTAFNEPGNAGDELFFGLGTRRVKLTETTRLDNARYFGNDINAVPEYAITAGPATIALASTLLLLVKGEAKAEALRLALEGPCCPTCPSSMVQRHPNVLVLADEAAVSLLKETVICRLAA